MWVGHSQTSAKQPRRWATLSLAALLAALGSTQAEAAAGRFQFVYGEVQVTDSTGRARTVSRGSEVDEGDVISTTGRGTAQLRMADGAALAVRPRSQVRIDTYRFENKPDSDRSFLSLLRGTLRSITGLVGRSNRSAYRVRTPTATIGIRGSDADIGFNPDTGLTAVRTYTGGHSLTARDASGNNVTIDTNPGQIAVVLPGQSPTFSNTFPFATPAPRAAPPSNAQGARRGAPGGDPQRRRQAGATQPGGPGQAGPGQPAPGPAGQGDQTRPPLPGSGPANLAGPGQIPLGSFPFASPRIAPFGTAVAGGFLFNQGGTKKVGTGTVVANNSGTIVLDGGNRPVAITNTGGQAGNIQIFRNTAVLRGPAAGFTVRDLSDNPVSRGNWGAYGFGVQVVENGLPQNQASNFHFVTGTNQTTPGQIQALGSTGFTYNLSPAQLNFSNEAGNFATVRSGMVTGNFNGTITVDVSASGFGGGSDGWTVKLDGSIPAFVGTQGITNILAGSTSSAGTPSVANASGRFVGPAAEGIIMSVGARTTGGAGVVGTGVGVRAGAGRP